MEGRPGAALDATTSGDSAAAASAVTSSKSCKFQRLKAHAAHPDENGKVIGTLAWDCFVECRGVPCIAVHPIDSCVFVAPASVFVVQLF